MQKNEKKETNKNRKTEKIDERNTKQKKIK